MCQVTFHSFCLLFLLERSAYTLLCMKYITNKNLLCSTENSTQYSVKTYMTKESKKEWIYIYVCVYIYIYMYIYIHFAVPQKLT